MSAERGTFPDGTEWEQMSLVDVGVSYPKERAPSKRKTADEKEAQKQAEIDIENARIRRLRDEGYCVALHGEKQAGCGWLNSHSPGCRR